MRASPAPALKEACTTPAGTKALSPGPRMRFSRSIHCSTLPATISEHLLLVGVLVEVVALAGGEGDVDDGERGGAGRGRVAEPAELAPVERLGGDVASGS